VVNWLSATPAMPAIPEPRPNVSASTRAVRMPIARAIGRFCETARISRPSRVLRSTSSSRPKTIIVNAMM